MKNNPSQTDIAGQAPEGFWDLVEAAEQDETRFRQSLRKIGKRTLAELGWTYEELAAHLRTERHARYADPALSEDGMAELANWIVALGRGRYAEILAHPDRIPPRHVDSGFMSQLIDEYEQRFGEDFPFNSHIWDADWRAKGKKGPWSRG